MTASHDEPDQHEPSGNEPDDAATVPNFRMPDLMFAEAREDLTALVPAPPTRPAPKTNPGDEP